jgi:hypothetical protein
MSMHAPRCCYLNGNMRQWFQFGCLESCNGSILKLSVINTNKKKALVGAARMANQQMCLQGLHPMKGDNVMETWGEV